MGRVIWLLKLLMSCHSNLIEILKSGPRSDAPESRLQAFVNRLARDELVEEETSKGVFFFARKSEKGQPIADLLPEMVQQILANWYHGQKSQAGAHRANLGATNASYWLVAGWQGG